MTRIDKAKLHNIVYDMQRIVIYLRNMQEDFCYRNGGDCNAKCEMYRCDCNVYCFFDKSIIKLQKMIKAIDKKVGNYD